MSTGRRVADGAVMLVIGASVAMETPELAGEFASPITTAQWVVPWSELVYIIAGSAAVIGVWRGARWAWLAAAIWSAAVLLAATFAARAYGAAPWSAVVLTGGSIAAIGGVMVWWIRKRTLEIRHP